MLDSLFHFEPLPDIFKEYPGELQSYILSANDLYDNRFNINIDKNNIEKYKKDYSDLKQFCSENKENEYAKWLEQYYKRLLVLIQKEYQNPTLSIISFLLYYLKTPYLIIDDPILKKTCNTIPGCSYSFISKFLELTVYQRFLFIIECFEAGINFNSFFTTDVEDKIKIDFFNILETFKQSQSNLNSKLYSIEFDIKSDFSRYFEILGESNKKNCKEILTQLLNSSIIAEDLIDEMLNGKYQNKIINYRLKQKSYIDKILKTLEDSFKDCNESIEENTLYIIHEKCRPYFKSENKYLKSKKYKYLLLESNINNLFLQHSSENRLLQLQSLYKQSRKHINTILHNSTNLTLETLLENCNKYSTECKSFFILFHNIFDGDFSLLKNIAKQKLSNSVSSSSQNIHFNITNLSLKAKKILSTIFYLINSIQTNSSNKTENTELFKKYLNALFKNNNYNDSIDILLSIESNKYIDAIFQIVNKVFKTKKDSKDYTIDINVNNLLNNIKIIENLNIIELTKSKLEKTLTKLYTDNTIKRNSFNDSNQLIEAIIKKSNDNINKYILYFTLIFCLIDDDSEFYKYAKSFQTLITTTESYDNILNLSFIEMFPESLYLISNFNSIKQYIKQYIDMFVNKEISGEINIENLDEKILNIYKDKLVYTILENGKLSVSHINTSVDLSSFNESFLFDDSEIMSKLAFLQFQIDLMLKRKQKECLDVSLDILLYQPFNIINVEDLNTTDLNTLKTLLSFVEDENLMNIACDYLVKSCIESFRNIVMKCFYTELNSKSTKLFKECLSLNDFQRFFKHIEVETNITLSDIYKKIIFSYFSKMINKMKTSTTISSSTSPDKTCTICNKNDNLALQTITVQQFDNTLIDKVENFCSIECMDIHLASAPTPNEKEIKIMYIRSLFRELLKQIIEDEKQILNIIRYFKLQKYINFCKKNNIEDPFSSSTITSDKNLQNYIKTLNKEIETVSPTKSQLINSLFYTQDEKGKYMFLQLFNNKLVYEENNYPGLTNYRVVLLDIGFTHKLETLESFLEQCGKHFSTNNNNSSKKCDIDKLFKNKAFITVFHSIIHELNDTNLEVKCETNTIDNCEHLSIKMIKEYIKQIYSSGKNENLISDILQKFNSIFHCETNVIIYDTEVTLFFNIVKSVQLLHIIFKFFKQYHSYKLNNFESYFNKEKENSKLNNTIDFSFNLTDMINTLKMFTSSYVTDEATLLKQFYKLIYTFKNNINSSSAITYFLNYSKCNFYSFLNKLFNSAYIGLLCFDYFLIYSNIETKGKFSNNSIHQNNENVIDKWIQNLEQIPKQELQELSIETVDNNSSHLIETKIESEVETDSDSSSNEEEFDDDLNIVENSFKNQTSNEDNIHPTIKLIYKRLMKSNLNEDIIDTLEMILPDEATHIDESFIDMIDNVKQNPTSENKFKMYEQIAIIADHPLYK
jgi:hypothetical protein